MADGDGGSYLERCAHLVYNQEHLMAPDTARLERRLADAPFDRSAVENDLARISESDAYVRFHARRMLDQARVLASLAGTGGGARKHVLDVGISAASTLYARHLPIVVQSAGLPSPTPAHVAAATFGIEAHHYVDFEVEGLGACHPELAGSFDAIMFCEVIEHVRASPAEQIGDMLGLLRPGGHLVVTTPNALSRHWLARLMTGRLMTTTFSRKTIQADGAHHYHVREYTMLELCDAAASVGGEVVERGFFDWYGASAVDDLLPYTSGRHALMLVIRRPG